MPSIAYADRRGTLIEVLETHAAPIAAVWGGGTIALANMPPVDLTLLGFVAKTLFSAFGFLMVAVNWRRILDNLDGYEVLGLGVFTALCIFAAVVAIVGEAPFSLYKLFTLLGVNVSIFLMAKLLDSPAAIERYLSVFAFICFCASLQALVAFAAEFAQVRRVFLVSTQSSGLSGYDYSWFGLLGRVDPNMRTMFYFTEPAYFGQLLAVALFVELAYRRWFRLSLVSLTMLSSFAIAAWGGAAIVLLLGLLRLRMARQLVLIAALVGLVLWIAIPILNAVEDGAIYGFFTKFKPGASGADKTAALFYVWQYLGLHPLGAGLVNLEATFNELFNSSPSLVEIALYFGVFALPLMTVLCLPVAWQGFIRPASRRGALLWMGLGGAMISTLTAGPLLKYWMVFFFSVLLTLRRVDLNVEADESARRLRPGVGPRL